MPNEIKKRFPNYWKEEDEEGSKNQFEEELLMQQLKMNGQKCKSFLQQSAESECR